MEKENKKLMKEYMSLPCQTVLNHSFELNESALAGYIKCLLDGRTIKVVNLPYNEDDFNALNKIYKDLSNSPKKELLGKYIFLTQKMICIIKKYQVEKDNTS